MQHNWANSTCNDPYLLVTLISTSFSSNRDMTGGYAQQHSKISPCINSNDEQKWHK